MNGILVPDGILSFLIDSRVAINDKRKKEDNVNKRTGFPPPVFIMQKFDDEPLGGLEAFFLGLEFQEEVFQLFFFQLDILYLFPLSANHTHTTQRNIVGMRLL